MEMQAADKADGERSYHREWDDMGNPASESNPARDGLPAILFAAAK